MKSILITLTLSVLLAGCGRMLKLNLAEGVKIGGKILPLQGMIVSSGHQFVSKAYASTCTDNVYARLYKINEDGKLAEEPIQSVLVKDDSSYLFEESSMALSPNVSYQVMIVGCDMVLSRPITDLNLQQDVTYLSTVVGEAVNAEGIGRVINQVTRIEIEALITATESSNLNDAFTKLSTDLTLKAAFVNVFQSQPDVLLQTLPTMTMIQIPSMVNEGMVNQLKLGAYHWNSSYTFAYEWYVDGVLKHIGNTWNYSPDGNGQGNYSIRYIVGWNNGSGRVDTSKPYLDGIVPVAVLDTIPAAAPDFSVAGNATVTSSRDLVLELQTGAGMAFCESFTDLALTEEFPSMPTNMSWFNISCDTPFLQNISYSLVSPGEGVKTLRLWAKDAAGTISPVPKTVTIHLDETSPVLAFNGLPGLIKGGASLSVSFSVTDSSATTAVLSYSTNGTTYTTLSSSTASPYSWSVPALNTSGVKLKLVATDLAGNSSELISSSFTIDSTAPASPVASLTSANPTNSTSVTFSLSNCTDVYEVSIGEGASPVDWESCNTNMSYNLTGSTQGARTLKIWARDAAGNMSSAGTLSLLYDSVSPLPPSATLATNNPTNLPAVSFTISDCTDRPKILINSGTAPTAGDAGWINCLTLVGGVLKSFSISNATETFHLWSKDLAENVSLTNTSISIRHDDTPPSSLEFIVAPKAEDPGVGHEFVGTSFVNTSAMVQDAHAGTKVRLKLANAATGECSLLEAEKNDVNWKNYNSGTSPVREIFSFNLSPGDGTKKVCLWSKDTAGNISSVISDDVEFRVGNIPQITSFVVKNGHVGSPRFGTTEFEAGETVSVSWTIDDLEGLDLNPVTLDYMTISSTVNVLTNYGSLSGNPTNYSHTYTFPAPTSGFFRLKLRAKDSAGNSSVAVISDSLNTDNWSIYAGSTDRGIGGGGKAALIQGYTNAGFQRFAINPKNNDIWVVDYGRGILKLDAVTGLVSMVIKNGTTNLGTSGTLDDNTLINVNGSMGFLFGHDGMLYLLAATGNAAGHSKIYKINPSNLYYELYAGGGNTSDSSDPLSLATLISPIALDEDLSLYVQVHCSPGTTISAANPHLMKLVKITQNSLTKKADVASHVAGDCSSETYTFGVDARTTRFAKPVYPIYGSLAVWDRGDKIVFSFYSSNTYKIIGGKLYSSNISAGSGSIYNKFDGKVYNSNGGLRNIDFNLSGNGGDTATTVIPGTQALNCTDDEISVSEACGAIGVAPYISETGTIFFMDGATLNNSRASRVRFIGDDLKVRTVMGSQPNNSHGLHKSIARAPFGGIYYKKASEPGQNKFPEGLYFVDHEGVTLNYIDPVSGMITRLLGNQSNIPVNSFTDIPMSRGVGLGQAYGAGSSGKSLMFDELGHPIMVSENRLLRIDENHELQSLQTGSTMWHIAAEGSPATSTYTYVTGGRQNLTGKSNKIFMMGGYNTASVSPGAKATLKILDFATNKVSTIIGGTAPDGVSAETTTPGSLQHLSLSGSCNTLVNCMIHYDRETDYLYFSEANRIRYIENVSTPASHRLRNLFSVASGTITNFIFTPSKDQIFYLQGGYLYCHNLTATSSWCNDSLLGPIAGLGAISNLANQMTWLDDRSLLISTFNGEIFRYNLPDN